MVMITLYETHFLKYSFLFGLDLCCGMQDLCYITWDLSLWCTDSLIVAWRLWNTQNSVVVAQELRFSVVCGSLVPWPGIEPMFPAWQGGLLATGPPGKYPKHFFLTSSFSLRIFPSYSSILSSFAFLNKMFSLLFISLLSLYFLSHHFPCYIYI